MGKKKRNELDLIIDEFDEKNRKIIEDFLNYYKGSSNAQYKNAVYNMLFEVIEKTDVSSITFEDYIKVLRFYKTNEKNESSQDKYRSFFFRYLYAFDVMKNPRGFEDRWLKNDCISHFNRKNEKKVEQGYVPSLRFEELERIEEYINMECQNNKEKMKTSFLCYMLYYTELSVSELKRLKTESYANGKIISADGKEYEVPSKYRELFTLYLNDTSYNGFHTINDIISKLGNIIEIENLTPQTIKNAKKQNSMCCGICGRYYLSNIDNWVAVNGKLVCLKCADDLKKT